MEAQTSSEPRSLPAHATSDSDATFMGDLVDNARQGQSVAFEMLMEMHREQISCHCRRFLANDADIEDIVQVTFLKAHRAIHRYEPRCSFAAWLKRIASNACIDLLRQRQRRPDAVSVDFQSTDNGRFESGPIDFQVDGGNPERELERQELASALRIALDELPARLHEAFHLREHAGMAYSEIAETLGVSLGVVKSRIYYARQALMQSLISFKA